MILDDVNWDEWVIVKRSWWRGSKRYLFHSRCSGVPVLGLKGLAFLKEEESGKIVSMPLETPCELIEGNAWGTLLREL